MTTRLDADVLAVLRKSEHSSHREQLIEYTVLSELLQDGWLRRGQAVDVLRPDVDAAGYDVVLQCGPTLRHVQFKSTVAGGATQKQKVHTALAQQPSGCVVWVVLEAGEAHRVRLEYLVLGNPPGRPLTGLEDYRPATHTKGNAQGHKAVRPALREVPRSAFTPLRSTAELSDWLFGAPGERMRPYVGIPLHARGPSGDVLCLEDLPSPEAFEYELSDFGHTLNGYDVMGSFEECASLANRTREEFERTGRVPSELLVLRVALFFEARGHSKDGASLGDESLAYWRALVAGMRRVVRPRSR